MICIATYATKSYCYAQAAQAPLIAACLSYARISPADVVMVFVGDDSRACGEAFAAHQRTLGGLGAKVERIILPLKCNRNGKHQRESNLVIARMQAAAFDFARSIKTDLFWSLEADILPPPNVLQSLIDTLAFDRGHYSVAMASYANERILGGCGDPRRWISPTVYPHERDIPDDLAAFVAARSERQKPGQTPPSQEEMKWWRALDIEVERCPPIGNVFVRNANGWRPRGWFEDAYPGVGIGAILPSPWIGMGCTLISERALAVSNFLGYDGGCTQDLWLCWRAWHPHGLRRAVTTHSPCGHVKRRDGKLVIHHVTHEADGERQGHLNVATRPWHGW